MRSITFADFAGGLDVRRGASVADANRLRQVTNAYVTTGKTLQKRPCLRSIAQLEAGTVGLKAALGKLNTFYAQGSITHANALFKANKVAHPTVAQAATKVHFGEVFNGFMYAAIEYVDGSIKHHYLDGSSPTHIADANCPNTKEVLKQQSKIYARGSEVVRFCATNAPRDWTAANDAGFLATGFQALGSTQVTALGQFGKKKLTAYFADGIQIWDVDPDPAQNALNSIVPNIGTRYAKSPFGLSGDEFFLSDGGWRSIGLIALSDNYQDVDVGSAIDALVTPTLTANADPASVFYPGLGQFLSIDGSNAFVYAFSRTSKLAAWSRYQLPVAVDASAALSGDLYIRSGNIVYLLDKTVFSDGDFAVPTVTLEFPYLDFKLPGHLKQIFGVDSIGTGTANLQLKYMANVNGVMQELLTNAVPIIGGSTTAPGPMMPVEMMAVAVAPVITHAANEDFRLDALTFYFDDCGPM